MNGKEGQRLPWWLAALMGLIWCGLVWWTSPGGLQMLVLRCLAATASAVWVAGFVLIVADCCRVSKEATNGRSMP